MFVLKLLYSIRLKMRDEKEYTPRLRCILCETKVVVDWVVLQKAKLNQDKLRKFCEQCVFRCGFLFCFFFPVTKLAFVLIRDGSALLGHLVAANTAHSTFKIELLQLYCRNKQVSVELSDKVILGLKTHCEILLLLSSMRVISLSYLLLCRRQTFISKEPFKSLYDFLWDSLFSHLLFICLTSSQHCSPHSLHNCG